jgi:hypothetical protein
LVLALAVVHSQLLHAAPLFSRVDGSLAPALSDAARYAAVQLDHATLRTAKAGSEVSVDIPDVGMFRYRIVRRAMDGDVLRLEGLLIGHDQHRMTVGVRKEGVSGLISTPRGMFSLGYVNGRQWLGVVGKPSDWSGVEDSGRPALLKDRAARKGEEAPVPGAQPIEVNLAELTALQEGDEATLRLSDLGPLRVSYDETRANQHSASWIGHLKDFGLDFRVILTYSPTGTTGHILTPQGEYMIQSSASGQAYLIEPRRLGLRPMQGGAACATAVAPVPANADAQTADALAQPAPTPPSAAAAAAASTVVDVLVLYTPGFVTDKGGVAQAQAVIDHLLTLANQAYLDSGVSMQLRKAGAEQVNASDATTNRSMLTDLTNGAGPFSGVKARRDALGADLVSIVRPFWNQYHSGCGIAWVGGYGGTPISQYSGNAYSVVSEGLDRAGTGWYCDVNALAHELGHNMGLMHDRAAVAREGGGQGATSYAYGYGSSGTFGTVMSYLWPKLGKFSNPDDYSCAGSHRCGIPESDPSSADNAKALNFTRTGVAAFRSTSDTNPPPALTKFTISGTVTVNGAARSGVTISGASCTVTGRNGVYQCTVDKGFSGVLTPSHVRRGRAANFTPSSRAYSNVAASVVNQNYAGAR